jgi:hypothetical protein
VLLLVIVIAIERPITSMSTSTITRRENKGRFFIPALDPDYNLELERRIRSTIMSRSRRRN